MYTLNRRSVLTTLAVSPVALAAGAKKKRRPAQVGGYSALTAPDAAGRAILAHKLSRLDQGRLAGQSKYDAIKNNMQQIIEQSVARLDPMRISRLTSLPDDHKRAIAQLYVNSSTNSPRPPLLYDLLATRLTGPQLAEHAQFFGFVPLYTAVARSAPEKLRVFESIAATSLISPTYGGKPLSSNLGITDLLDMTLGDIWIAVRLAPIGLYSLPASAFTFVTLVGGAGLSAWGIGYGAGTALVSGLQTFAPSVWDKVVDGVGNFMQQLQSLPPEDQGPTQELGAGASLFDLPETTQDIIVATGGDYMINEAWAEYADWGGAGGGGACHDCVLV